MGTIKYIRPNPSLARRAISGASVCGVEEAHGSYRAHAGMAIAAMGSEASYLVPIGTLGPYSQWLGWPQWLRDGTGLTGSGRLPNQVTMADDLMVTANMLDRGFGPFLLEQTIASDRLITGPSAALVIRNAPTLGEALYSLALLITATNHNFQMTCREIDEEAVIEFEERVPLGKLMGFLAAARIILVQRTIERFLLQSARPRSIELSIDDQQLRELLARHFRRNAQLGSRRNFVTFPASIMGQPNPDHDPALWRLAKRRIGRMQQNVRHRDLASKLRQKVANALAMEARVPKLKELALEEGVSERTLGRQLCEIGVHYQDIVEAERKAMVKRLLADPALTMAEIADMTGFANASSFSRTFRCWFETSPSEYRR